MPTMPQPRAHDANDPWRGWAVQTARLMVLLVVLTGVFPLLWPMYFMVFPQPAPRTPSALVINRTMSRAMMALPDGVRSIRCDPHGRNPDRGWFCAVSLEDVGQPVRMALNGFDSPAEEALYHGGLTFSVTAPDVLTPRNLGEDSGQGSPLVALSVDPDAGSFEATQDAVMRLTMAVESRAQGLRDRMVELQARADDAAAQAAEARKTPAQRAADNRASWRQTAQDEASPPSTTVVPVSR